MKNILKETKNSSQQSFIYNRNMRATVARDYFYRFNYLPVLTLKLDE